VVLLAPPVLLLGLPVLGVSVLELLPGLPVLLVLGLPVLGLSVLGLLPGLPVLLVRPVLLVAPVPLDAAWSVGFTTTP
jgi:hypothetical protein